MAPFTWNPPSSSPLFDRRKRVASALEAAALRDGFELLGGDVPLARGRAHVDERRFGDDLYGFGDASHPQAGVTVAVAPRRRITFGASWRDEARKLELDGVTSRLEGRSVEAAFESLTTTVIAGSRCSSRDRDPRQRAPVWSATFPVSAAESLLRGSEACHGQRKATRIALMRGTLVLSP